MLNENQIYSASFSLNSKQCFQITSDL